MKACKYCNTPARSEMQKFCAACGKPFDMSAPHLELQKAPVRVEVPAGSVKKAVASAEPVVPKREPAPTPQPKAEPRQEAAAPEMPVRRRRTPVPASVVEKAKATEAQPEQPAPVRRRPRPSVALAEEQPAPEVPVAEPEPESAVAKKEVMEPVLHLEKTVIPDVLDNTTPVEHAEVRAVPQQDTASEASVQVLNEEEHGIKLETPEEEHQPVSADVFFAPVQDNPVQTKAEVPRILETGEEKISGQESAVQKSPASRQDEPSVKTEERSHRKIVVLLPVLLLAVALAAGGFFVWKKIEQSKYVTVGGSSYSIEETSSLSVENPSDEDWNSLCSLPNLASLIVTGNGESELTEAQLEKLAQLQKLTEFSADGIRLPGNLSELLDMNAVESLSLTNCKLTSGQFSGVSLPTSLRKLKLADNALTDISFLQGGTQLEELDISGNKITDYMPLTAMNSLTSLSVDLCQVQVLSGLKTLKDLTVNGQPITDTTSYLAGQEAAIELYSSMADWFENSDFSALNAVLQQLEENNALNSTAQIYANGWLMDNGSEWNVIKESLPAGTQMLLADASGLYYGQMQRSQRSGNGVELFAGNGSIYSGMWANDLPNGTGIYRKTTADGTTLEFSGSYVNGLENGTMTFQVANATGSQAGTYTASSGTRTTVQQIGNDQYAFIQFDTIYWYDANPTNHGVAVASIPYQEEKAVQIQPQAKPEQKVASSGSKSSNSGGKSSASGSSGSSTPQASTPADSTPQVSGSSSESSSGWTPTPEETRQMIREGVQAATDIYRAAKGIYDLFN